MLVAGLGGIFGTGDTVLGGGVSGVDMVRVVGVTLAMIAVLWFFFLHWSLIVTLFVPSKVSMKMLE